MSPLRVVFAGTPDFAASSLAAVLDSEHEVVAVYTQPDRPAGRGRKLTPSPVKQLAQEHGLPVVQPASLKDADDQAELAALNADVMVVVAYGLLLPQAVLDTPRLGCINVHASLLPRWRGAAPIQRAIEAGDSVSGVTIMQMDAGLDTGAMLYEVRTPITSRTTGGDLHDRLAIQGANALIHVLDNLDNGSLEATPQPEEGVTYAAKLSKAEAELDFSQPAEQLARKIRAFNPWPVAWCPLGNDRLRLLMASVEPGEQPPAAPGTLLAHGDEHLRIA
ncbi:MAG: methionyl-tRNA formyltransferase, partial [Halomonas sp.]|nr:methionyl-tRNA formyltransferase [Halomonas sp.]